MLFEASIHFILPILQNYCYKKSIDSIASDECVDNSLHRCRWILDGASRLLCDRLPPGHRVAPRVVRPRINVSSSFFTDRIYLSAYLPHCVPIVRQPWKPGLNAPRNQLDGEGI